MARFNATVTLLDVETTMSKIGTPNESITRTIVFANRFNLSSAAEYAARAAGLRPEVVLQVRTCEYSGQERAIFDGIEYEVDSAVDSGDFTRLTLVRRLPNV